ncbi:hypothetical protein BSNK01_28720 [Bacillaceae bacterium]
MNLQEFVGKRTLVKFIHLAHGEMEVTGRVMYTIDNLAFVLKRDDDMNDIVIHIHHLLSIEELR